jgi:superfamily II DNA or RNA helicase
MHMPTGSGKTRTAMHVIARHLQQYEPTVVCWLANSAELAERLPWYTDWNIAEKFQLEIPTSSSLESATKEE